MSAPLDAPKLDAPVREELLAGLTSARLLPQGTGFARVSAGANHLWTGDTSAFFRGDVGWHPTESTTVSAFAKADLKGVQGGVSAEVKF